MLHNPTNNNTKHKILEILQNTKYYYVPENTTKQYTIQNNTKFYILQNNTIIQNTTKYYNNTRRIPQRYYIIQNNTKHYHNTKYSKSTT